MIMSYCLLTEGVFLATSSMVFLNISATSFRDSFFFQFFLRDLFAISLVDLFPNTTMDVFPLSIFFMVEPDSSTRLKLPDVAYILFLLVSKGVVFFTSPTTTSPRALTFTASSVIFRVIPNSFARLSKDSWFLMDPL